MIFIEKYVASINSGNLMDDDRHHGAEALAAAALADRTGSGLGALLCRVKYADGSPTKLFESGSANLAQLLRIWTIAVIEKGRARNWVRIRTEMDIKIAGDLFKRVAQASLAHWIDGHCIDCRGSAVTVNGCACPGCGGSGRAPVTGYERDRVLDMVSELEGLVQAHSTRAASRLRHHD